MAYIFEIKGALIGFVVAPMFALLFAFKIPKAKELYPVKKLVLYSIPLIGFALLSVVLISIDLFFVKSLIGGENTGFYTANQNIARIPFFAFSAFSAVIFPAISQNVSQDLHQKSRNMIHQSLRFVLLLLIPGVLLISGTSDEIIELLYSSVYLPAASSLSILIIGMGFLTVFTLLANILNGAGNPGKSVWIAGVGVVITAFSCVFMVPKYELVGAALSTTVGSFVAMVLATYFVYQRFHALVPIKSVVKIITSSLIVAALAYYIKLPVIFLPILYIALFTLYFGLLIMLKELTSEDWRQVKGLVPSWVPYLGT